MEKINFVEKLKNVEKASILEIIDLFHNRGITDLDVSNPNGEYDDVQAYCFDDDCHSADNIKIDIIRVRDGYLYLVDDSGIEHSVIDFHIGTFSYIYNAVFTYLN